MASASVMGSGSVSGSCCLFGFGRAMQWGETLLLAVIFAVAHTQSPLFYSNQNQYLLHGLAAAGVGYLHEDWLANTRDPTPLFSWLVAVGYRQGGSAFIHGAYFLLLMVYFISVRWLVTAIPPWPATAAARWSFAAVFTAAHAAGPRLLSVALTGTDYPWYLQCGVANQYLLGPGLQPSAFGVLLVSGLAALAHRHPLWAAVLTAGTCLFHPTYLLPAGLLLTAYVLVHLQDARQGPVAGGMVLLATLMLLPVMAYTVFTFGSANPHTWSEAQRILVEVRIPHHAVIDRWFAGIDALQLGWVVLGLYLVRSTPWGKALMLAAAGGLTLSLMQYWTQSHLLALLFPWRISAVLVPVATAIISARLAMQVATTAWVLPVAGAVLAGLGLAGGAVMALGWGYQMNRDEEGLLGYVREHVQPGQTYLLPVRFPAVRQGRGTASTTFTPAPRPRPDSPLIPVDLQRFRLATGAPIYVDFKAIPYYDLEVLEWYRRMQQCEQWYAGGWDSPQRRDQLRCEGITHVVAPAAQPLTAYYLRPVYHDAAYVVYRVE